MELIERTRPVARVPVELNQILKWPEEHQWLRKLVDRIRNPGYKINRCSVLPGDALVINLTPNTPNRFEREVVIGTIVFATWEQRPGTPTPSETAAIGTDPEGIIKIPEANDETAVEGRDRPNQQVPYYVQTSDETGVGVKILEFTRDLGTVSALHLLREKSNQSGGAKEPLPPIRNPKWPEDPFDRLQQITPEQLRATADWLRTQADQP